jgi:hypothetical protein
MVFKAQWRRGIAGEAGTGVIDHIFKKYPTPVAWSCML